MSRPPRLLGASLTLVGAVRHERVRRIRRGGSGRRRRRHGLVLARRPRTTVELDAQPERVAGLALTEATSSGVTVLPVAGYPVEGLYLAKAPDDPSLRLYAALGVQFVDPGGGGYLWQTASWEAVPQYPSDVLLYSLRGAMTPEEMSAQPTYRFLPAVQAGQVHPWEHVGMDHTAQARYMEQLAGWLAGAEKVS